LVTHRNHRIRDAAIFSVGLIATPLIAMTLHAEQDRSANNSNQAIANAIERQFVNGEKVFVYRNFEDVFSSLPFYLERKVQVVDSVSADLQFGCHASDHKDNACISLQEFKDDTTNNPVAVAVDNGRLEEFYKAVGRNGWRDEAIGNKHVLFNY
jgi:hypothetical protein